MSHIGERLQRGVHRVVGIAAEENGKPAIALKVELVRVCRAKSWYLTGTLGR
jgi:hypothetical protein